MRATSIRRLTGGAAALLLAGATLISASGALAAIPTATATNEALPATVTGGIVGFRTILDYQDNASTLSRAYVTVFTDAGAGTNRYVLATKNGSPVAGACTVGVNVTCSIKTVRPGDRLIVTVAYDRLLPTAAMHGVWSSTGVPNNDDNSHGDTWQGDAATATLVADGGDYAGSFAIAADTVVANGQGVSSSNIQATKVVGVPVGVAAVVFDGADATGDCGTYCAQTFGNWSEVSVGDGQTFSSLFQIVITFNQGAPKSFVHSYTDSTGDHVDPISACGRKGPGTTGNCFTWNSKLKQATIYTLHNGSWKGL